MPTQFHHVPVLQSECLDFLALGPGSCVLDGTLGGAGHAEAILERTAPDGILIGLDLDEEALAAARERLSAFEDRVRYAHASFRRLDEVARSLGLIPLDAVLLDLGVSSHQLDRAERGFRFSPDAAHRTPLDMRMDPRGGQVPASTLLARASAQELQLIFQNYGELPGSKRLARAIVEHRAQRRIETAADLLAIIREARIGQGRRHNPATLVFQALRIAVNDELGALESGLEAAIRALRPGGRLVVIAYHSLEDRIVKRAFRTAAKGCVCPPEIPLCQCGRQPTAKLLTRRPISASEAEVAANPRARSARLRAIERIGEVAQ